MFEAIRSKLVGAWKDLRSRGLVTLFFFELVVVTLGVLIAQGVSDWAGERAADRAMEEARSRAHLDIGSAARETLEWDRLSACFERRAKELMKAAASGTSVDAQILRRPGIGTVSMMPIEPETLRRIGNRHGTEEAESIRAAAVQIERFQERQVGIVDAWKAFARIDPAYGEISSSDRAAAREAAADILSRLRGLEINGTLLQLRAREIGAPLINPTTGRFVRDCEELWAEGRTFLDFGETGNAPN